MGLYVVWFVKANKCAFHVLAAPNTISPVLTFADIAERSAAVTQIGGQVGLIGRPRNHRDPRDQKIKMIGGAEKLDRRGGPKIEVVTVKCPYGDVSRC